MINFPCTCNHAFSLADDMAGGLIQCPKCGRLNDVPTLSDLAAIESDGTYKIEASQVQEDPHRIVELQRIWAKDRSDGQGGEIDLRHTEEDYRNVGSDEVPLELKDELRPGAPKYDPDTGQLVRPLGVKKDDDDSANIPMATPVISYASGATAHGIKLGRAALDVLMPTNLVVIFFILLAHIFFQLTAVVVLAGFVFIFVAPLALLMSIVAHYANTIDEIGPEGHDELPRPARNLNWHDDLWGPFYRTMAAFMLSYIPALFVFRFDIPLKAKFILAGVVAIFGTIAFPALVLTTTTSGTMMDLRPDRVLGVMRACGKWYALAVGYWVIAVIAYVFGLILAMGSVLMLFIQNAATFKWWMIFFGYGVLASAIYLMHVFAYHLGLLYRAYHDVFPWEMQRHTSAIERRRLTNEERAAAQRERRIREQRRAQG